MRSHPGGEGHTRRMLELADLAPGSRILDLGAGAGEAVFLLRGLGFDVRGIDLEPRGEGVERGNLRQTAFADGQFDAILSQCAFFVSGGQEGALREAARLLKSGGKLLLSDVFFEDPLPMLARAGFRPLCREDMSVLWREYYLEALWREDICCPPLPRGKCSYWLLIAEKEEQNGSV